MTSLASWLIAFTLTVAVELPVVLAMTRGNDLGWRRCCGIVLLGQLITHPLVWFIFPTIPGITGNTALTLSELYAWLGEAAVYAVMGLAPTPLGALGIAGVANGLSLAAGYLLFS
jgi:hypothetical protein